MEEKWKTIEGYEGLYEISTMGRVKSIERKVKLKNGSIRTIRERILKPGKDGKGYLQVALCKEGIQKNMKVHRLVASTFLTNQNNFPQINHKNEIKTDNRVENLEWITNIENIRYGTGIKRSAKSRINNPKRSKKVICIETNQIFHSVSDIERQLGFSNSNICNCCNGKRKSAYKLHWRYVD